ncbi:ATP-binding cassette sub-family A member 3 [Geodia barretti]|uniref:ATP-binding cassette sub-family A member 3 n=2 Tax=Geodia barretti TaxID=519541 RepID=A0AA35U1N3_GEOBA|nr:ATP-binding cassette sub-family A member 3 [Geodia barretti]
MTFVWSRGRQLLILLWKNFLLQVRRPIGTVVELLIPPVACMVVITLRFTLFEVENRCHLTFDPDPLTLPVPQSVYQIYYAPNTSQAANEVAAFLRDQEFYWSVKGVASEQELVDELTTINPPAPPISLDDDCGGGGGNVSVGCFVGGAGVVFVGLEGDSLEYTLRLRHEVGDSDTWHTRETSFWLQRPGARVTDNAYLAEGFLHLQNRVARALVDWSTEKANISSPPVQVSVKQIPYPSYHIDTFLNWNAAILPLLLIMAFIYTAGMFTKELVLEKETRIRESMLMMGLKQWVLWTTWFIKQFLFLFVSSLIVAILLKYGQVFPKSNVLLLLLFFTLFATASISWGFFMSVWFSSARLGMVVSFVAWFFLYIPFFYFPQHYHTFTL